MPMRTSAQWAMLTDATDATGATTVRLWERVYRDSLQRDLLEVVRDTTHPAHAGALLRRSR